MPRWVGGGARVAKAVCVVVVISVKVRFVVMVVFTCALVLFACES